MFLSPISYVLIGAIFALERRFPARAEQRGFSPSVRFDAFGPLRYVLVTPQSHRIHHSSEPEHWNSNYTNIFCWDRLFGMQHPDDQSYPTTGVNDLEFPEPATYSPMEFGRCFVRQTAFPFRHRISSQGNTGSPHAGDAERDRATDIRSL